MRIINIFKIKIYLVELIIIICNLVLLIICGDFCEKKSYLVIYIVAAFIILFHYLLCIFLESEFESNKLNLLQIQFENKISFITFIAIIASIINYGLGMYFLSNYFGFKLICPFSCSNFDYKLHLERRCELYDINFEKKSLHYICSYNASKISSYFFLGIFPILSSLIESSEFECNKVESLIDNDVINNFIKEYYKEEVYYCNFTNLRPQRYKLTNAPNICQSFIKYLDAIIIPYLFFVIYYINSYFNYNFRNIRANLKIKMHYL